MLFRRSVFAAVLASSALAYPQLTPTDPSWNTTVGNDTLDGLLGEIGVSASKLPGYGAARRTSGVALACTILETYSALTSKPGLDLVLTQDDADYKNASQLHWSETAVERPACIYTPNDLPGLSVAVRLAGLLRVPFAVRSGGHSPFAGFASIDGGGLLISTGRFRELEYDARAQTMRSGMGNRWGAVYGHLARRGRIVVGGRYAEVGMGLTLGGGLSNLSNKLGWVSQHVLAYEVMLASGRHVRASATENGDLYQAIKAGQNNFGIVTHVVQRTFPSGKVWGGLVAYPANQTQRVMQAIVDYQQKGQLDTNSAVLPYVVPTNDTIFINFVYLDGVERPAAFEAFYDIPSTLDQTRVFDSFVELASISVPASLPRWTWGATTMLFDRDAYLGLPAVFDEFRAEVSRIQGGTLVLFAQPISRSMVEQTRRHGEDPMNATPATQLWLNPSVGWLRAEDTDRANELLERLLARVEQYSRSRGVYDKLQFINDAHYSQKPFQSFGADRLQKMRAVSRKYDPKQVFQKLAPGGFKLY